MPGAAGEGEAGDGDAAGMGWAGQQPASPPLVKQSLWTWESQEGCEPVDSVKRVWSLLEGSGTPTDRPSG